MTVFAHSRRTPAMIAAERGRTGPAKVYTQDEQRQRRRQHLENHLLEEFDLVAEFSAILDPLAQRLTAEPIPAAHREYVETLLNAADECLNAIRDLILDAEAQRKLATIDLDHRGRARTLLSQASGRHRLPEITDGQLVTGEWAAAITACSMTYSGGVSSLLARAADRTISERVETALRLLDRGALSLARRIDRAEFHRREFRRPAVPDLDARAELAKLGVTL